MGRRLYYLLFCVFMASCHTNVYCDSIAHKWSYDGLSDWNTYFPDCNGTEQSPINIIDEEAIAVSNAGELHFENYHAPMRDVALTNNGKTVKLSAIFTNNLTVSGLGMYLQNNFTLQQVHFHWGKTDNSGSEHRVNGRGSAMEVHFVHFNSEKYPDITKAQLHADGILVLAVLVDVYNRASFKTVWKNITYKLSDILKPGLKTQMDEVSLEQLLPKSCDNFYFYRGSFTTPACYQSVTWVVFKDRALIPQEFLQSFRDLQGTTENGEHQFARIVSNTRPVQRLNSRVVLKNFNTVTSISKYVTTAEAVIGGHGTVTVARFHACQLPPSFDVSVTIPSLDINWKASNLTSGFKGFDILDSKQSYAIAMQMHDHPLRNPVNTVHVKIGITDYPTRRKPNDIVNHYFQKCGNDSCKWLKPAVELTCRRQAALSGETLSFTLSLQDACSKQYRLIIKKDTLVLLNIVSSETKRVQLDLKDAKNPSDASLKDWYFVLDIGERNNVNNVKLYLEISHVTLRALVMDGNFGPVRTCSADGTAHHVKVIVGVAVGIFIIMMVLLTVCLLWRRFRQKTDGPMLVPQAEQDSVV